MNQSSSLKPIFIWYAIQSTSPTWPFGDESLGKEEIGENNKLSIFLKLNIQNWRVAEIILFGKCNFHLRVKRVCITNKRKVISWLLYQVQKLLSCKKGREKASISWARESILQQHLQNGRFIFVDLHLFCLLSIPCFSNLLFRRWKSEDKTIMFASFQMRKIKSVFCCFFCWKFILIKNLKKYH